jgi:hypothetical protein
VHCNACHAVCGSCALLCSCDFIILVHVHSAAAVAASAAMALVQSVGF